MHKGLIAVATLVVALTFVGTAGANEQAFIHWVKTSSDGIIGDRSSIGNPDSSQATLQMGEWFITSVWATNGQGSPNDRGLQQGVHETNSANLDPYGTCQNYDTGYYFFVETDAYGTYTCDYEAAASGGSSHLETVLRDGASGDWYGWRDGVKQSSYTHISWNSQCSDYACQIFAFGEENAGAGFPSYWQAKFSGSGNTPWQFTTGSSWNTINSYYSTDPVQQGYWCCNTNLPSGGGFPGGNASNLWYFVYNP